jgi:hypothetical protein|nr:MAG TPA: hypothetical protein [Caudoviricetes sp.]
MIQLRQKTKTQEVRENRDRAIYEEYEQLLRDPQQSRIEAQRYLQRKYGFARQCTIYDIWRREARRREAETAKTTTLDNAPTIQQNDRGRTGSSSPR